MHAHPDDESIGTGATIARYAAEGAQVTLVTCTLGELGEIIPPELAHLAADRENAWARTGSPNWPPRVPHSACRPALSRRAGRWRDSG